MATKSNRPESEIGQRSEAVRSSAETSFRGLLDAGGFDLIEDLRYQNLSGLSFADEDLRGLDFTGANLCGCNFSGAEIRGARFDRARLGNIRDHSVSFADLSRAIDYTDYVLEWKSANPGHEDEEVDSHLFPGDIFFDSPQLPLMVVLSICMASHSSGHIAMSWQPVSQLQGRWPSTPPGDRAALLSQTILSDPDVSFSFEDANKYFVWAQRSAHPYYRIPYHHEWAEIGRQIGDLAARFLGQARAEPWTWCFENREGGTRVRLRDLDVDAGADVSTGAVRLIRRMVGPAPPSSYKFRL